MTTDATPDTGSVLLTSAAIVAADAGRWFEIKRFVSDPTTVVRLVASGDLAALFVKHSEEINAPQPLGFIATALGFLAVWQSEALSFRPLDVAAIFRQIDPQADTFLGYWLSPGASLSLAVTLAGMHPPSGTHSPLIVDVCDEILRRSAEERDRLRRTRTVIGRLHRWIARRRWPQLDALERQRIDWNEPKLDALCVDTCVERATHLAASGRSADAEANFAEALTFAESLRRNAPVDGTLAVAHVHAAWGSHAAGAGDHKAAIDHFGRAIAQIDEAPQRPSSPERPAFLARALRMRARSLGEVKDYGAARRDHDRAASIGVAPADGGEMEPIRASEARGIALARMDAFVDAAAELSYVVDACRRVLADHSSEDATECLRRALSNRGYAFVRLLRFEEALRDFDEAEHLSPSLPLDLSAPIRQNRGNALLGLGRPAAALKELEGAVADAKALVAQKENESREGLARALCDRGTAHYRMHDLQKAIADFYSAVDIYDALNEEAAATRTETALPTGVPPEERVFYEDPPPHIERIAATLMPVTAVLLEAEGLDEALEAATQSALLYQRLVDIEGRLDLERYVATAHSNLSIVLEKRGDLTRAFEHAGRSVAAFRRMAQRSGSGAPGREFADALTQLADLTAQQGDLATAVRLFEESADRLQQTMEHAETELERQRRRASHADTLNGLLAALVRLAEADDSSSIPATPAAVERGATWAERAAFWAEWGRARNLSDLVATESHPPVGIETSEFAAFEEQRVVLRDVDQRLAILEQAGARAAALDQRGDAIQREAATLNDQRAQLLAGIASALDHIRRIDPSWAPAAPVLGVADIKAAAAAAGADLLTLRTTKWGTCVILAGVDGTIRAHLIPGFDGNALGQLLGDWLSDYATVNRTPPWHRRFEERTAAWRATQERVLDAIGATLWRPLTDWLASAGVASAPSHSRPIVVLAGIGLVTLPLHAARWEDGTQVVHACDRYEITYAPSVAVIQSCLDRRRQQGGPISLLAVQNPTGHTGRSNLAWSEVEVDAACRACPDFVRLAYLDHDRFEPATAERLKRELPRHTIALLATHGIYDSTRPWTKSGLFTADTQPPGIADPQLTIGDFYEMDLGLSQLILLTACESGLTDPLDKAGEQSGLASAMLASGASAVIASLWAVDDMSTSLLTRRFFEEVMREPPISVAAALASAQGWLRQLRADDADHLLAQIEQQLPPGSRDRSPRLDRTTVRAARAALAARGPFPFSHVSYWAPFCCFGATGPLVGDRGRSAVTAG
jgi:CHAT domain-containing protein/tetratricopeptide (TPR) repeat protein